MENPGDRDRRHGRASAKCPDGWMPSTRCRKPRWRCGAGRAVAKRNFGQDGQNQSQNIAFSPYIKAPRGHYDDRRALKHDRKITHSTKVGWLSWIRLIWHNTQEPPARYLRPFSSSPRPP